MVLCDTGSVVPSGVEQRYWGDRTSSSPLPTFFVDSDSTTVFLCQRQGRARRAVREDGIDTQTTTTPTSYG